MKRLLLLAALAACSKGGSASLTFGAAGPWNESYGAMNRRGIELAQEEINARPERQGRPLVIDYQNDEGKGEKAVAIAQRFVDAPAVIAVVGHVNSGAMVSAVPIYDGHLAAVATTATSPALTGISTWAFRVIASDSANGVDIAKFALRRGRKRAAILYENNIYGRGLADSFRRGFSGQIVSMDPIPEGKEQSFEPFVSFFKQQKPDVIFVAGTESSGLAFLKEARRQQLTGDLMGGDGWSGLSSDSARADGVFAGVPFTATDPRPEAQTFVAAFQAKFSFPPDNSAALAYDATMLVYQAAKDATSRREVRDGLAALRADNAFRGVTGPIFFHADGDPVGKSVVMTRIERGRLYVAEESR